MNPLPDEINQYLNDVDCKFPLRLNSAELSSWMTLCDFDIGSSAWVCGDRYHHEQPVYIELQGGTYRVQIRGIKIGASTAIAGLRFIESAEPKVEVGDIVGRTTTTGLGEIVICDPDRLQRAKAQHDCDFDFTIPWCGVFDLFDPLREGEILDWHDGLPMVYARLGYRADGVVEVRSLLDADGRHVGFGIDAILLD